MSSVNSSEVIAFINLYRSQNQVQPVHPQAQLIQAAQNKANDIIQNQYWSHTSSSQTTPWYFIDEAGYRYEAAGENLARNFPDSQSLVEAWIQSPGHQANMLEAKYQEIGIGIAESSTSVVVVAVFAKPLSGDIHKPTFPNFSATKILEKNKGINQFLIMSVIGLLTFLISSIFIRKQLKQARFIQPQLKLWHER